MVLLHSRSKTIARKGEGIYHARLKKLLEPKYHGWYVAIEVESGDYFLGQTTVEALEKAEKEHPAKKFYIIKVGFPAAVSFKHPISL